MLRDAGVRTKLLAVLTIPTLLLVLVTGLLVGGQVGEARRAGQIAALTEVAVQVNRVVHSLQDERRATLVHLEAPDADTQRRMQAQRAFTNRQLVTLRDMVAASALADMSPAVAAAVARSAQAHDELAGARASIDAGRFYATETDVFYTKVIRADLDLPGVVAASSTPELGRRLQAYQALSSTIEYAAHERDLVEVALLTGTVNEAEFAQAAALVAQQRQALQDFQAKADGDVYARLDNALARADNFEVDQIRRRLPELLDGAQPDKGDAVGWASAAGSRIAALTQTESLVVADVAQVAGETQNSAERQALLVALVSILGLGLAAMLAIGLARRITRPLRRLTVAAGEIGDELPRMVERMQVPGEGPGVVVEPIPVESADEIGRLAEAFNTVNDVTVQVAKEQAALRASIAEMFVNVARRNQVLLGRQLKALDDMEAREEDPDVLQRLFTLDHLATRMRRNAESLLVLAGIDSTRRLRRPLPLSDVIRTAVGEIEAYDRIDLSMSEDPEVSGRHALTIAHLLAELLENATHFSNPDTRVVVAAALTGQGVTLTVTDHGIGMSDDEVAEANAKIAHPPVAEIAVSQRLGLFVVGRLAARLGVTVTLRRGRAGGTVAEVALPASVFEGMAVTEPEAAEVTEQSHAGSAPQDAGAEPVAVEPAEPAEPVEVEPVEPVEPEGAPAPAEAVTRPRGWRRWLGRRPAAPATETDEAAADREAVDSADLEPGQADAGEAAQETAQPAEEATQVPAAAAETARPEVPVEAPAAEAPAAAAPDRARADLASDLLAPREVNPAPREVVAPSVAVPTPAAEFAALPPVPAEFAARPDTLPAVAAGLQEIPPVATEEFRPAYSLTAAVDILPTRSRGGLFGRRGRRAAAPSPSAPARVVGSRADHAPSTPESHHSAASLGLLGDRSPGGRGVHLDGVPAEPVVARSLESASPEAVSVAPASVPTVSDLPSGPPREAPLPGGELAAAPLPGRGPGAALAAAPAAPSQGTGTDGGRGDAAPAVPAVDNRRPLPTRAAGTAPAGDRSPAGGEDRDQLDRFAARSELAASALSELRGLYEPTYTPAAQPAAAPAGLTRRTPRASQPGPAPAPAGPSQRRGRDAAEVRGMLSGFRAGVERGRSGATPSAGAEPVPPAGAGEPSSTDPTR